VWDLVSDLEAASHYLPDIERIEILGGSDRGVGASRRLFTSQSDWLDATVLEWDEGRGLVLQLHRGDQAPFPFANASFEYTMQALSAEATAVHLSLVYLPRYGLLGQLLDSMFLGDRAEQQVMAVAKGLKRYSNADQ
jgi:ribosome-associated toxin RatA of RatAB toxin-antitoxin module